jgi:hypothetical protein
MSTQLPYITQDIEACKDIFNKDMCENYPLSCLDQCLIKPLKNVPYKGNIPVIIIIDGLDECFHNSSGVNDILNILQNRVNSFPSWIKFLVSSRPDKRLNLLTVDLQLVLLSDDSIENLNDIEIYKKTYEFKQVSEF